MGMEDFYVHKWNETFYYRLGILLHQIHNINKHKIVRLTIYEDAVEELVGNDFELDTLRKMLE